MLTEIFCRNPNDPGYTPQLETKSSLEALLTKIRMIIFTGKGEILGHPEFGLSLEDQLFELSLNASQIQRDFYDQLSAYAPEAGSYAVQIEINFQPGEVRDICFIDIYIDNRKYLGVIAK